jgi:hypothetical protein
VSETPFRRGLRQSLRGFASAALFFSREDERYAYFADERRLAIERGDDVIVYDTADHRIHGVAHSQSGSGPSSLVFTSQHGTVALDALKVVDVLRADD